MADLPNPVTRKELYLKAIADGNAEDLPEPVTREEVYLDFIAENGSGRGGSYKILGAYDTLAELQEAHSTGQGGDAYLVGDPTHVYVWLVDDAEWYDAGEFTSIQGPQGPKGEDGGPVPVGGTTGQVLKKKSNADGDVEWADESGGGVDSLTTAQVNALLALLN